MSDGKVSIVIPSYNGIELLREFLPAVLRSLEEYPGGGELIVVEDGGSDGTVEWLGGNMPAVKCVVHQVNRGFAHAANSGVEAAENDAVLLLNNDMLPRDNLIAPLVETLYSGDDVFAVAAGSIIHDGTDESPTRIDDDDGILKISQPGLGVSDRPFDGVVTVAYAPGGMSLFRRDAFLELGGFDDLYRPFYWEDADLSWKAWRAGWRTLFDPRGTVDHRSHGTIGYLYKREIYDMINHANRHIFNMRFLEGEMLERYLGKVNLLATEINQYDRGLLRRSFFKALARVDEVMKRRKADVPAKRSVEEIIELSSNVPVSAGGAS